MKALFVLSLLALSLAGTQARAADCVSKEDMSQIAQHFSQFNDLAGKEYCYDGSQKSHLIAGIMFMRQTQFENPMNRSRDEFFSGRFASNWFDYFVGRIDEFEIDEGCPKGVAAYVYAFGGRTMYVCTMMLSDNYTALDRASVFMHEARHIDGYPHTTCRSGPRQGLQGACDVRISDGGSYAVTVETYAQLSRYAIGIHPALKAYARSSAAVYADEAFDTKVRVDRTQQFVAMARDGKFHQVKADGSTTLLGSTANLGKIVMRSVHMILFPENKTEKARFLFVKGEGEISQQAGDLASEYNSQTPEQRANLVDAHIAAQWSAKVYKDKVRFACDPRANTTQDIALNGDVPVGLLYLNGYDRAAKSAQLMTESGRVLEVGCANGRGTVGPSNVTLDRKYTSVYKVGDKTLGLVDGSLREINGSTSREFSLGALDGTIYEIAPNQSFDFFNEK